MSLPLAPLITAAGPDPRLAINSIAQAGFRHIQLNAVQPGLRPRELDQTGRRDLLAVMRRREITPSGMDFWIPTEHFLENEHVQRAVDATIAAIVLASDLGQLPVSMILPANEQAGEVRDAIIAAAQQCGVPIADHTAPPSELMLPEPLGIGIDPAAWLGQGEDPATAVTGHAGRLVSARICDLNSTGMRCPVGQPGGRLDVAAYAVALSVAAYQRPVVIDSRQWPQPWDGVQRTAEAWAALAAP